MLNNISVVLVETSHPGNIGSSARAMKTMGFGNLSLVNPKKFPHPEAVSLSSKATDILEQASVHSSLDEAIANSQLVIGASARRRDLSIPMLDMDEFAETVLLHASSQKVSLVFGREHAGLTNQELIRCHYHIAIPSAKEYPSLNLSQAVQVLTYEIRKAYLSQNETQDKASYVKMAKVAEVEGFYKQLEALMIETQFISEDKPKRLMPKIRRLFNRIQLEHQEVNILRGILSSVERQLDLKEHS